MSNNHEAMQSLKGLLDDPRSQAGATSLEQAKRAAIGRTLDEAFATVAGIERGFARFSYVILLESSMFNAGIFGSFTAWMLHAPLSAAIEVGVITAVGAGSSAAVLILWHIMARPFRALLRDGRRP